MWLSGKLWKWQDEPPICHNILFFKRLVKGSSRSDTKVDACHRPVRSWCVPECLTQLLPKPGGVEKKLSVHAHFFKKGNVTQPWQNFNDCSICHAMTIVDWFAVASCFCPAFFTPRSTMMSPAIREFKLETPTLSFKVGLFKVYFFF